MFLYFPGNAAVQLVGLHRRPRVQRLQARHGGLETPVRGPATVVQRRAQAVEAERAVERDAGDVAPHRDARYAGPIGFSSHK